MSTHVTERVNSDREGGDHEAGQFDRGLLEAAMTVWESSQTRAILDLFISGEIHSHTIGGLYAVGGASRIFWHNHGTFVAKNGAIYQLRTDDSGMSQSYVSPVDSRGQGLSCIRPYTYDNYNSPDGSERRFDFVNGAHRSPPINSLYEVGLQRHEGLDVARPRHQDGVAFDGRRDSISVVCGTDGITRAMLHDSETGTSEYLYDATEVKTFVEFLDTLE